MTDLISRADAINAVHKYFVDKINNEPHEIDEDGDDVFTDMKSVNALFHHNKMVSKAIKALPSAETHEIRTETHGVCLISKDDAMGAVQDHFNADGFKGYDDGQKMMDRIKALPSADAVQGEWVRKYDDKVNCYWYECDQCGEYRPRNQFGHEYNANFCPNCGARMTQHKGGDSE